MENVETVTVKRPDHPNGQVTINKSDMQPGDVIVTSNEDAPAKRPYVRKGSK